LAAAAAVLLRLQQVREIEAVTKVVHSPLVVLAAVVLQVLV
jgi:hypothetical protein